MSSEDSDEKRGKKDDGASSSDSDDADEYLDEMNDALSPMKEQEKIQMAQRSRTSVSAEVFGKYHIKEAFKAKVIPKGDDVKRRIEERLL